MQQPPLGLARAFSEVYARVLPGSPLSSGVMPGLERYSAFFTRAADGMRAAGAFDDPEQWRFDWERPYDRDQWLDAVDAAGGGVTMRYAAVAVTAERIPA